METFKLPVLNTEPEPPKPSQSLSLKMESGKHITYIMLHMIYNLYIFIWYFSLGGKLKQKKRIVNCEITNLQFHDMWPPTKSIDRPTSQPNDSQHRDASSLLALPTPHLLVPMEGQTLTQLGLGKSSNEGCKGACCCVSL